MTASTLELGDGAWVRYQAAFVPDPERLMHALTAELSLAPATIVLFGREHVTPRLVGWYGDPTCRYRYSGRTFDPRPWTPALAAVRTAVSGATGYAFNAVLVNVYRNGDDAMGAHSDDERELGPSPDDVGIASVSLGARRRFVLRHEPTGERHVWAVGEGDLLLMGGTTQRHCKHWLPRTRRPVGLRMNLTFRVVVPGSQSR